jgi:hypothetical protein
MQIIFAHFKESKSVLKQQRKKFLKALTGQAVSNRRSPTKPLMDKPITLFGQIVITPVTSITTDYTHPGTHALISLAICGYPL